ncbi:MAG: hypothetical protein ACUVRV_01900 [Cyanobacteriota bacterium]
MVSPVPLFAVAVLEPEVFDQFPGFKRRFDWFMANHLTLRQCIHTLVQTSQQELEQGSGKTLLAIVNPNKLRLILQKMLDESESFSPYGIFPPPVIIPSTPIYLSMWDPSSIG